MLRSLTNSFTRLHLARTYCSSQKMGKLDNKVAVVTASTDGIGLAIAQKLGRDGAKLVISSRKQKNVDATVDQLKSEGIDVVGIVCHVGKDEHRKKLISEAVSKYGTVDILVSNAAVSPHFGRFIDTTEQHWDKLLDINVKAAFMLAKEVFPVMEKNGSGSIIFVSSITGYTPDPFIGAYSVTKTALLGMVKALAAELGPLNIRVNGVAPGIIKTQFSKPIWSDPDTLERFSANIPLRRMGDPVDCGGVVSYLASDEAAYVTGETMVVAGGMPSKL